jgi:hypothetical protein
MRGSLLLIVTFRCRATKGIDDRSFDEIPCVRVRLEQ